jgi:hypothetical protein
MATAEKQCFHVWQYQEEQGEECVAMACSEGDFPRSLVSVTNGIGFLDNTETLHSEGEIGLDVELPRWHLGLALCIRMCQKPSAQSALDVAFATVFPRHLHTSVFIATIVCFQSFGGYVVRDLEALDSVRPLRRGEVSERSKQCVYFRKWNIECLQLLKGSSNDSGKAGICGGERCQIFVGVSVEAQEIAGYLEEYFIGQIYDMAV